jgi:hypothetical protein
LEFVFEYMPFFSRVGLSTFLGTLRRKQRGTGFTPMCLAHLFNLGWPSWIVLEHLIQVGCMHESNAELLHILNVFPFPWQVNGTLPEFQH